MSQDGWVATHRHYKGGLYRELMRGTLEATMEPVVIYENEALRVWVRPAREFDQPERFQPLVQIGASVVPQSAIKPGLMEPREAPTLGNDDGFPDMDA